MQDLARRYTVRDLAAFPEDGNRYEIVHGELLVTPSPATRHQRLVARLMLALGKYLEELGLEGTLYPGPADISWDDETLVQPDILVTVPEQSYGNWDVVKHLRLAVEVLSPSSRRGDRVVKRRLYQERGVETYWIVDPDARVVEVWRPGDEVAELVTDRLRWRVTAGAPELVVQVPELFASLPG
jgi:Uma2 family endonuclease